MPTFTNPFEWVTKLPDRTLAHAACKNGIQCDGSHGCRNIHNGNPAHERCQNGQQCTGPGCRLHTGKTARKRVRQ